MTVRTVRGRTLAVTLLVLTLTACSARPTEYQAPAPFAAANDTDAKPVLPSSWSTTEKELYETLAMVYPQLDEISTEGKLALIDNTHLICAAYSEGATRAEILSVTDAPSMPAGLADDLMTLSVMNFCPEYTDQQLGS